MTLEDMRGPQRDRMLPQPTYWALKQSVYRGCRLCSFIYKALGACRAPDGQSRSEVLKHVSAKYPGRELALTCWGQDRSWTYFDRVHVATTGEVPDSSPGSEAFDDIADPSLPPDHQFGLSGVLGVFTYPGMVHSVVT